MKKITEWDLMDKSLLSDEEWNDKIREVCAKDKSHTKELAKN